MENIKWLWGEMDKRYHKWHILGLIISAVTSQKCFIIGKIVSETNRTTSPSSSCPKSMMRFPRNPITSPASP